MQGGRVLTVYRVLELRPREVKSPHNAENTEKMHFTQRKKLIRERVDVLFKWQHSAVDVMDPYGEKDTPLSTADL